MKYRFRTTTAFRRALAKLPPQKKISAKAAFAIFKEDPFDPRLRTHKIHRLSSYYGKTIYAACVEGDLRVIFYLNGSDVISADIGTHAIYRS